MENYNTQKDRDNLEEHVVHPDFDSGNDEVLIRLGELHRQLYAPKSDYVFTHRGDPFMYENELLKRFDNNSWTDSRERASIIMYKRMTNGEEREEKEG